jgi:hypothetical protein
MCFMHYNDEKYEIILITFTLYYSCFTYLCRRVHLVRLGHLVLQGHQDRLVRLVFQLDDASLVLLGRLVHLVLLVHLKCMYCCVSR